jgi:hypothetical protein
MLALPLTNGPRLSALSPRRDLTGAIPTDPHPPSLSHHHYSYASEVRHRSAPPPVHCARIPSQQPTPSRLIPGAVRHHRRRCAPRRRQLVFSRFPPRAPIKGTARAPPLLAPATATPPPFPWTQSSSAPLPPCAPVSSPSFLQWSRVKLTWFTSFTTSPRTRHTILLHLSCPVGLTGDLAAAGARHLTVDRPPKPPLAKLTPPPRPPRTRSLAENHRWNTDGQFFLPVDGSSFSPWRRFPRPRWHVGPRPRRRLRAAARARLAGSKSPPVRLTEKSFSFSFFFLFPIFLYIYTHIDILCTKNSPNIL